MPEAGAQDLPQAAPGPEPAAAAGAAMFNPFGTLGVVSPVHPAVHATPPAATGSSTLVVVLVAVAVIARLLRWVLE